MTDSDDEALRWEGDDRLQAPRATAPRPVDGPGDPRPAGNGAASLLVLGVLGGVAVLETLLWIRGLLLPTIIATLGRPSGGAEAVAYGLNVAARVLAAAAPAAWFGAVLWRVRRPSTRLSWLLLGAVLLVPWPFVLGAL